MKRKNRAFINFFDVFLVLFIAAIVVLIAVFVSPTGKTVTVSYTVNLPPEGVAALSVGDSLSVVSGGTLGTVTKTGDGFVTVTADAELHAGHYYSGAVLLSEGGEYVVCSKTTRFICTLQNITKG